MRVAGIAVAVPTPKRPVIRIVVIDDSSGQPVLDTAEEITLPDVEMVEQLFQAGRGVESRLVGLNVDRVVVREAEAMHASRKDGPRRRMKVEGAVAAAARSAVEDTRLGAGSDLGQWTGSSKDAVDADGKALVASAGANAKYVEAAAAALVAVRL